MMTGTTTMTTGNREQGTGNREQGTGNREHGTRCLLFRILVLVVRCARFHLTGREDWQLSLAVHATTGAGKNT